MKKILLLAALLFFVNTLSAQLFKIVGHEIGFAYLGPKVGSTFSKITNTDNSKVRTGFQIGAVGEIGLTRSLSVESEITFISKGVATDLYATRVNYLSIPLLAKLSFRALGLSRVYATGGTYNNIRTNAKVVYDQQGQSFDETHHYKTFDWGLALGAGAAYDTKYGLLCLDLRYDLGIVDIARENTTSQRFTNRTLGAVLTFKYDAVDLFIRMRKKQADDN